MRIVFFGTPAFAASILDFLLESQVSIVGIVTQPDRPKGRSLQILSSPVKQLSTERAPNIPIFQPQKAQDPAFLEELKTLHADLFVVVAFGQILPQSLLDIPPKGCINIHASLLPKYRGASPIRRALLNGDTETGISVQKMVKQLDAGDVIATARTEIEPNMTFQELEDALCALAKPLLLVVLRAYEQGIPPAEQQDATLVSHAPKISVEEGEIHWDKAAQEVHNLIRAFSPRPGAWCYVESAQGKKRLKILRTKIIQTETLHKEPPGTFLSPDGLIACAKGTLQVLEMQQEGKKTMSAAEWLRGYRTLPCIVTMSTPPQTHPQEPH